MKPKNYYNMYKDELVVCSTISGSEKFSILTLSDEELFSICRYKHKMGNYTRASLIKGLKRRVKVLS